MTTLDKQLADTEYIKHLNWGKILTLGKRQFDEWATRELNKHGYEDFKMVYMPILMNIKPEGTTNHELVSHTRVTKQAVNKVVKELQKIGYIKSKASLHDKRSTNFILTEKGKKLVIKARHCVKELMDAYRKEFGKEETENLMKLVMKFIEFTDRELLK